MQDALLTDCRPRRLVILPIGKDNGALRLFRNEDHLAGAELWFRHVLTSQDQSTILSADGALADRPWLHQRVTAFFDNASVGDGDAKEMLQYFPRRLFHLVRIGGDE